MLKPTQAEFSGAGENSTLSPLFWALLQNVQAPMSWSRAPAAQAPAPTLGSLTPPSLLRARLPLHLHRIAGAPGARR